MGGNGALGEAEGGGQVRLLCKASFQEPSPTKGKPLTCSISNLRGSHLDPWVLKAKLELLGY